MRYWLWEVTWSARRRDQNSSKIGVSFRSFRQRRTTPHGYELDVTRLGKEIHGRCRYGDEGRATNTIGLGPRETEEKKTENHLQMEKSCPISSAHSEKFQ